MKYRYRVSYAIIGPENYRTGDEMFGDAPAAIKAATLAYCALEAISGMSHSVPSFNMIRQANCPRVAAEPASRSFVVTIEKYPR